MHDTGIPITFSDIGRLASDLARAKAVRMGRTTWRITVYQNGLAQFYTDWTIESLADGHAQDLRDLYRRHRTVGIFVKKEQFNPNQELQAHEHTN